MYLALPVSSGTFPRAIRVSRYSRTMIKETYDFRLRDYYPLGCFFPETSSNHKFFNSSYLLLSNVIALRPPASIPWHDYACNEIETEFGLFRFRSPLLTKSQLFYFPPVTEMFYFTGCVLYVIHRVSRSSRDGFPHSDISGSKITRHLPEAYRRQVTSFITIF